MNSTSVGLLRWRCVYGGFEADGTVYDYLVTKDSSGWVGWYHPAELCRHESYALVPFGRHGSRRKVQKIAEEFERKHCDK